MGGRGGDSPYYDLLLWGCWCPCYLVSSFFGRIGRCMASFPVLQRFGLDNCRRHHHHQKHILTNLLKLVSPSE
ncbi:hypothetical protein D8674_007937 [Pyrus ussuriensis x Pyrus communis]|uniref:Uncharacterized protein n=1 Tax=Pyrus ussuriensis x Pyrus communis TaxID=2448454 RepID=A0A5N5HS72_9ROSA|nr:hypothetical protein D8674_007937 [Pyrus ussuriensis x Pyrus communis]